MRSLLIITLSGMTLAANMAMSASLPAPRKDSMSRSARKNPVEVRFAARITQKGLHDRLAVLTADSLEGRETGTAGAQKASKYIASRFASFGLKAPVSGSYFFNVPLVEKKFQSASLSWSGMAAGETGWSYYPTGRGGGGSTSQKELVVLTLPASADSLESVLAKAEITDKAVLVLPGSTVLAPDQQNFHAWLIANSQKISATLRKNPAALFLVDDFGSAPTLDKAELARRYASKSVTFHGEKLAEMHNTLFVFTHTALDHLLAEGGVTLTGLEKKAALSPVYTRTTVPVKLAISVNYSEKPVEATDVLGLLPGTDLEKQILVISAHYDHLGKQDGKIYHGADDDGSGSSALLSIAAAFSDAAKAGHKPRRSILFLANVGEEKGLLGSQYYSEHPVFAPANTVTDLNIDMIGRVDSAHMQDSNYVYAIGSGKLSSDLQRISEEANRTYSNLTLDYRFDDPKDPNQFYYRSDHYNFAKLNIPIIFYFNGVHADYHQPSDTIDKINFGIYQKRAQLVFYTAWELANRDLRPAVDRTNDFK